MRNAKSISGLRKAQNRSDFGSTAILSKQRMNETQKRKGKYVVNYTESL